MTFCSFPKSTLSIIGDLLCGAAITVFAIFTAAGISAWIQIISGAARRAAAACVAG